MQEEIETAQDAEACVVEISPSEVDAGADLTLTVKLPDTTDLRGQAILIRDEDDAVVGSAEFSEFDGDTNATAPFLLTAPRRAGEFTWSVCLPLPLQEAEELEGDWDEAEIEEELLGSFTFTVRAHQTRLLVWDVPSAITAGERFRFKLGVKCSSACSMEHMGIAVLDHQGAVLAEGTATDIWPGSEGLYWAEVEFAAPEVPGHYRWQARAQASEAELPHAGISAEFGVTAVAPPEFVVTVTALDAEKQTPLEKAKVVMHPYRATTDQRGIAEFRVARGAYRVFVSASKYEGVSRDIEVQGDFATTAELLREPPEDLSAPYR